jgi:hypothetical protein
MLAQLLLPAAVLAGGQAETGRSTATEAIDQGQLLPVGSFDIANYLGDFATSHEYTGPGYLDIQLRPLHYDIWESGETIPLQISLVAAPAERFDPVPGTYIIYIQNPEILANPATVESIQASLDKYPRLHKSIIDIRSGELLDISQPGTGFKAIAGRLRQGGKLYENNIAMQRILKALGRDSGRRHLMWISDADPVLKSSDRVLFSFVVELLGGNNISFSYLGHGEIPNWPVLNASIMGQNGNSWFARDLTALLEHLDTDLGFFARPAVERVHIDIAWSPLVERLPRWYPEALYGRISNFRPVISQDRPAASHYLGGMNYSEHKRFMHYCSIPSLPILRSSEEGRQALADSTSDSPGLTIATVYVSYNISGNPQRIHLQQDLTIRYRDGQYLNEHPRKENEVLLDAVIQNTPLVLLEASNMANTTRNLLGALQLLQAQRNLLNRLQSIRPEPALVNDLAMLEKYYDLVYNQARILNLLQ